MTTDPGTTDGTPPPDSILGALAARRQQIVEGLFLDLPVPRWSNPRLFIRCRPLEGEDLKAAERAAEKAEKRRGGATAQAELNVNLDCIIKACDGVFATIEGRDDEEGNPLKFSLAPGDPDGEWTKFDPVLAEALGLSSDAGARAVAAAVFLTDGDIVAATQKLVEFSGYTGGDVEGLLEGE